MKRKLNFTIQSVLLVLLVSACTGGAVDQEEATLIAQTVIAGVTETALANPTDTAEPTATDSPEPTESPPTETDVPTPVPTATLTPTIEPTPTATLPAGDPALTLGAPSRVLAFDPNVWFLYEDDHLKMEIEDGALELTAFNPESWEGWSTTGYVLENFYLEITGTTGPECAGKDRFGMIVRADDPNEGYLFGISCDGFFRLRSWNGETFVTLQDWTTSPLIRAGPDQTNRIGLMARDGELRMFINGVEAAVVEDETFDQGAFGVFVSSAATEGFIVTISDARYWVLQ